MTMGWYYRTGGEQYGPVTLDDLARLVESGQLRPADLVWTRQLGSWKPAAQVPGVCHGAARFGDSPDVEDAPESYLSSAEAGVLRQSRRHWGRIQRMAVLSRTFAILNAASALAVLIEMVFPGTLGFAGALVEKAWVGWLAFGSSGALVWFWIFAMRQVRRRRRWPAWVVLVLSAPAVGLVATLIVCGIFAGQGLPPATDALVIALRLFLPLCFLTIAAMNLRALARFKAQPQWSQEVCLIDSEIPV